MDNKFIVQYSHSTKSPNARVYKGLDESESMAFANAFNGKVLKLGTINYVLI